MKITRGFFAGAVVLACLSSVRAAEDETLTYLRLGKGKPATECTFTVGKRGQGTLIRAVTQRGAATMEVTASHDGDKALLKASATLTEGDKKRQALVGVANDKVQVQRPGAEAQELTGAPGIMVTSAPDWSDTFLLCRGYDLHKGGKQEFPGLWIHPEQPAQRLTFTIEKQGTDTVEHAGKKLELHRFLIRIRNNSPYAAWTDDRGRMIKLVALPFKEGAGTELVLEGFEKSVEKLRPARE